MAQRDDDDSLDDLYVGDFDGFVGRRNELAKRLKADGDPEGAARVKALKKPNRIAWSLNQFSAGGGKPRDRLLAAGTALREAQEQVVAGDAGSDDLREASATEREAVSKALDALEGARLSANAGERARQTLHAVALDEDIRRDFEHHRLTTDHDATSVGGLSLGTTKPAPRGGGKKAARTADKRQEAKRQRDALKAAEAEARKREARREDAEREVEAARKAAELAQRDLERATSELETAAAKATEARKRADVA